MSYANPKLTSSANANWQTPECVLERVRAIGPIVLDPCTVDANPCDATVIITPPDDGLALPWAEGLITGLTYVNCPYGRPLPKWVNKCAIEGAQGCEIVLLVPARIDTRWYAQACNTARAKCEWSGRLTFKGADHPAPFPSALFYWGPSPWLFCHCFAGAGRVEVMR